MLTILFDGIAYGSLLFLISVGLSVTMGLMNFVNLAHGAFEPLRGGLLIQPALQNRLDHAQPISLVSRHRDHPLHHRPLVDPQGTLLSG